MTATFTATNDSGFKAWADFSRDEVSLLIDKAQSGLLIIEQDDEGDFYYGEVILCDDGDEILYSELAALPYYDEILAEWDDDSFLHIVPTHIGKPADPEHRRGVITDAENYRELRDLKVIKDREDFETYRLNDVFGSDSWNTVVIGFMPTDLLPWTEVAS